MELDTQNILKDVSIASRHFDYTPKWLNLPPVLAMAATMFGWNILSEAALSFLGLGVSPLQPSWGNMLASGRPYISQYAGLTIFPGVCISFTLLGINMLGDAVIDRMGENSIHLIYKNK